MRLALRANAERGSKHKGFVLQLELFWGYTRHAFQRRDVSNALPSGFLVGLSASESPALSSVSHGIIVDITPCILRNPGISPKQDADLWPV